VLSEFASVNEGECECEYECEARVRVPEPVVRRACPSRPKKEAPHRYRIDLRSSVFGIWHRRERHPLRETDPEYILGHGQGFLVLT
jgi:hypothetical protein